MEKPLAGVKTFKAWVDLAVVLFSGVLGVLTKYNALPEWARKFINNYLYAWWALLGALFLLGSWFLLRPLLLPRSRLLQPERFVIRAEERRHLKGREDEIKTLSDLCEHQPLVFLEGESGAGKSALARAGLIDESERRKRLHPIYVDLSEAGWEERLRALVCQEVWRSLSDAERSILELKAPPPPEAVFSLLAGLASRLGRTPLLIFDQFDDYQSTYRKHFREGSQANTWITKETLIQVNPFWMEVARLLQGETVHCLFITRTDNAAGLDTVRFVKARTYRLARLNRNLIAPLLDEITKPEAGGRPVVSHPTRGWERLKKRLLRDLAQDGLILPVQLSVALQALRRLPALTVGEYERQGGAEGLERFHIERHIVEAAHASGLAAERVRKVLVSLVEPVKGKTVQLTSSALLSLLGPADEPSRTILSEQLQKALEYLEDRSIIRRRPAEEENEDAWLLHHDFLCRGVLAADRHANRWHALIREQARQYGLSAGFLRRWRALLSPWQQLRLAAKRLAGSFHYAEYRRFALLSTLRFTPLVLLLALLSFGYLALQRHQEELEAARAFAAITRDEPIRPIAKASERVQWTVLRLAFESEQTKEDLSDCISILLHLCVRLDPSGMLRRRFWQEIGRPTIEQKRDAQTLLLAARGWREAPGERGDARNLAHALVDAVRREEPGSDHFYYFDEFSPGIEALAPALSPTAAQELADKLLEEWDNKTTVKGIGSLTEGLKPLAGHLKPDQALRAAGHLVDASMEDEGRLNYDWGETLRQFSLPLDRQAVLELAARYVKGLSDSRHAIDWGCFRGLKVLLARLDPEGKRAVARQLGIAATQASNPVALAGLTQALELVAEQVEGILREQAIEKVLAAMEYQDDTAVIVELSRALGDHTAAMSATQGRRAAQILIRAMQRERQADQLVELGAALRAFSGWLEPGDAQWACQQQLRELEHGLKRGGNLEDNLISSRMRNLGAYAERLDEPERLALVDELLAIIDRHKNTQGVYYAVYGMKRITRLLGREQAHARAAQLVQAIEREKEERAIDNLLEMALAFGINEDPDQVRRFGERLVQLMENAKGLFSMQWLAGSFADIHDGLGKDLARRGTELMVKTLLQDQGSPSHLHFTIARSLASYADTMDQEQVANTLESVFAHVSKTADCWGLLGLGSDMEPLWRRASGEQLKLLAERVSTRLAWLASQSKLNWPEEREKVQKLADFLSHAPDQSLLNILKEPFTVDGDRSLRRIVLRAFELKYAGNGFDNDLWQFVSWATTNPKTMNLDFR